MTDILILAPNALHNPNIPKSASGEYAGLPFRHAYDPDPTKPWFIPDITNVTVDLDFDGFNKPKYVIVHKHNFTDAAEISYQDSNAADFSVLINDVSETPDLYAQGGGTSILVNAISRTIPLVISNPTGRYQRILINDPTNADARLEIGYIHIANTFSIKNCDYGWIDEYEDETIIFESDGGVTYARPRKKRRVLKGKITLGDLDSRVIARKIAQAGVGFSTFMNMTPFFIDGSFDPESTPEWLYGRFRKMSELSEEIHRGYETDAGVETSFTTFDFEFEEMEGEELEFVSEYTNHSEFVKVSDRTDCFVDILAPREPAFDQGADPLVWTNHSGNCWKVTYPINTEESWSVWGVYQANTELTHVADIATCISTEGSWFFDLDAERVLYVHCNDDVDPNDTDSLVQIAPIFALATEVPASRKWAPIFDLSAIKNIIARRVLCEVRLREDGLSSIEQSGESAFYGVSIPSLSSMRIINGKVLHTDTAGRMDRFVDRFQWKDTPSLLFHGDGGVVLDIDEHLYLDTFRVLSVGVSDQDFAVSFDSAGSALLKKIPTDIFATDDEERLAYKPILYGLGYRLPAYRLSPRNWAFLGHAPDTVTVAIVDGKIVGSGDYVVVTDSDLGHALIRFDVAPKEGATVEITCKRNVDIDGVGGEVLQLAGAQLRTLFRNEAGFPIAELPSTSFADLDTNYAVPIKVDIREQTTVREIADTWCRSLFAWCRRVAGKWEVYRYDPANLRASVATINEDEILSVRKATEAAAIIDRVRVTYWNEQPNPASAWGDHPTASRLFSITETLDIDPTFLYAATAEMALHASRLRDLYLLSVGADSRTIFMEATGECLKANYGDIVTVNRSRGFDSSGAWIDKKFIVRSIVKDCTGRPGTATMILVPPFEVEEEEGSSAVSFGNITPFTNEAIEIDEITTSHTVATGTDILLYAVCHNNNVIDETVLTAGVTFGGTPMDFVGHTNDPSDLAVKVSLYKLDAPSAGAANAVGSFDGHVDAIAGVLIDVIGATQVLNFGYAHQLENKKVSKGIASAINDLVLSFYGCIKAPADGEESMGAGQTKVKSVRAPFDDLYTSTRACKLLVSSKPGAVSVTCSITEESNLGTKMIALVSLRP